MPELVSPTAALPASVPATAATTPFEFEIGLDDPRPLDLEQQRRRARDLQRAVGAGDPEALQRLRCRHPKAAGLSERALIGSHGHCDDAQLVIARELGLPSWPALVAHAGRLAEARRALTVGLPAPDIDRPTLHVRCGSDIRTSLRLAGFAGDFLEVSDPVCQGPVPMGHELRRARVEFIAKAYEMPRREVLAKLDAEAEGVATAAERYDRVVLWFEHDPYDQLVLSRILAHFAEHPRPVEFELICIERFPQIPRFVGLGDLSVVELRSLWSTRTPIIDTQLALGEEVWRALRNPDPGALHAIASAGTPELPTMAAALRRHLQELPWTTDGLGLTERLTLQAMRSDPATGSEVFGTLYRETEPMPFLGDLMLWAVLAAMNRAERPPFAVDPATALDPWPNRRLVLTYDGQDVLDRRLDWLACRPPVRWVGGVRIAPDAEGWRWSPEREAPVAIRH